MDKFKALSPYILTGILSFAAGGWLVSSAAGEKIEYQRRVSEYWQYQNDHCRWYFTSRHGSGPQEKQYPETYGPGSEQDTSFLFRVLLRLFQL